MLSITPTCRDDHRRWPSFSSGGTYRYILSSFSPCLFIYLFVCLSLFAYACASVRVCCFFLLFFPFSRGRENDEQANRFGSIRLLSRPGDAARLPHYAETRQCKLVYAVTVAIIIIIIITIIPPTTIPDTNSEKEQR